VQFRTRPDHCYITEPASRRTGAVRSDWVPTGRFEELGWPAVPRACRKQAEETVTPAELRAYRSMNGSLCFIGMLVSPVTAFVSSHLQQALKHTEPLILLCDRQNSGRLCQRPRPEHHGAPPRGSAADAALRNCPELVSLCVADAEWTGVAAASRQNGHGRGRRRDAGQPGV
jgi:hypothetical protein